MAKKANAHTDRSAVPIPFVSWQKIVVASDPSDEPTRSKYRTLLKHGRSTKGIVGVPRSNSGVAGRQTIHSVLNLVATHAWREGNFELSRELVRRAGRIEDEFRAPLSTFLAECPMDQLPSSRLWLDFVSATGEALEGVDGWSSGHYASGAIVVLETKFAHLEGHLPNGAPAAVDLPRQMIDAWNLAVGDHVFVFQRMMQNAALVEVLPIAGWNYQEHSEADIAQAMMWPRREQADVDRLVGLIGSSSVGRRSLRPAG